VIAWVREHGDEYGADPEALFVAGSSAGGHMAAMAALTPNDPRFQSGFEDADTSVSAAITLYGYLGNYYGQGADSSPQAYVRTDAPPFFVAQGARDTYSPRFVEIARGFAEELRTTSSNPVIYAELPGAQHSFDLFHSTCSSRSSTGSRTSPPGCARLGCGRGGSDSRSSAAARLPQRAGASGSPDLASIRASSFVVVLQLRMVMFLYSGSEATLLSRLLVAFAASREK
jgi:acetyl esterase/lipase